MFDRKSALPPYTIRLDHRPVRTAFLVPEVVAGVDLDEAMLLNCKSMAGRCNIFVRTDGEALDVEGWQWLSVLDPDVIISFCELSESLAEEIGARVTPLRLVQPDSEYFRERPGRLLSSPGTLSTPLTPTIDTLRAARHGFLNTSLVDPIVHEDTPSDIRAFVAQNFGWWPGGEQFDSARNSFKNHVVEIRDEVSFQAAIESLSAWGSFTYPIQFAAAHARLRGHSRPYFHESVLVVVGDTAADRMVAWNTIASLDAFTRGGMPTVWIPRSLCEDETTSDVLGQWLVRTADPGGQTNKLARFWSVSIPAEELTAIAERLAPKGRLGRVVQSDWRSVLPQVSRRLSLSLREDDEVLRANANEEHVVFAEPRQLSPVQGPWMVDLYMEYNPEMYPNYVNQTFWWQFPMRREILARMISAPARINADRFPSAQVDRGIRVKLKIPDERTFFHYLLIGDSFSPEPNKWTTNSGLVGIRTSNTGRYFRGVIGAFGGLFNASSVLEERFWRSTFEKLGGRRPESEAQRKLNLKNRVTKVLKRLSQNQDLERAADAVAVAALRLAREEALGRRERLFSSFVQDAEAELNAFNERNHPNDPWEFDVEDVKSAVYKLMASGVLSVGLRRVCPACGSVHWFPAAEIGDEFSCRGCGAADPLGPEEPWHYRLNTLINVACNTHGLTPVILALGQLLGESRQSFIYRPSTVLLMADGQEDRKYRELDLVCVQDGRLIIGEVKESLSLFTRSDFDDLLGAAKKVRPDRLIFSAMVPEPDAFVLGEISRIADELEPLGVSAEWYQLHSSVFEPAPVR